MPRRKKNARKSRYRGKKIKLSKGPRICYIPDDGISPGKIVAAAEYVS
jgi:hypothetical protein